MISKGILKGHLWVKFVGFIGIVFLIGMIIKAFSSNAAVDYNDYIPEKDEYAFSVGIAEGETESHLSYVITDWYMFNADKKERDLTEKDYTSKNKVKFKSINKEDLYDNFKKVTYVVDAKTIAKWIFSEGHYSRDELKNGAEVRFEPVYEVTFIQNGKKVKKKFYNSNGILSELGDLKDDPEDFWPEIYYFHIIPSFKVIIPIGFKYVDFDVRCMDIYGNDIGRDGYLSIYDLTAKVSTGEDALEYGSPYILMGEILDEVHYKGNDDNYKYIGYAFSTNKGFDIKKKKAGTVVSVKPTKINDGMIYDDYGTECISLYLIFDRVISEGDSGSSQKPPSSGEDGYHKVNYYLFSTDANYSIMNYLWTSNASTAPLIGNSGESVAPFSDFFNKMQKKYSLCTDESGNSWYAILDHGSKNATYVHPYMIYVNGVRRNACSGEVSYIEELVFPMYVNYGSEWYTVRSIGGGGSTYLSGTNYAEKKETELYPCEGYSDEWYDKDSSSSYVYHERNRKYMIGVVGNGQFWGSYDYQKTQYKSGAYKHNYAMNSYMFYNTNLKKLYIPDSVTKIETAAFWGCRAIREISGCKNVRDIGNYAFFAGYIDREAGYKENSKDYEEYKYNGKGSSDKKADPFFKTTLLFEETVQIPLMYELERIGEYAYTYRRNMSNVTIPQKVNYVGQLAFYGTNIRSVVVEGGTLTIDKNPATLGGRYYKNTILYCKKDSSADQYGRKNEGYYDVINSFPVTYDLNGGEYMGEDVYIDVGGWIGEKTEIVSILPEKNGFSFLGWTTNNEKDALLTCGDQIIIGMNTVLFAVWEKDDERSWNDYDVKLVFYTDRTAETKRKETGEYSVVRCGSAAKMELILKNKGEANNIFCAVCPKFYLSCNRDGTSYETLEVDLYYDEYFNRKMHYFTMVGGEEDKTNIHEIDSHTFTFSSQNCELLVTEEEYIFSWWFYVPSRVYLTEHGSNEVENRENNCTFSGNEDFFIKAGILNVCFDCEVILNDTEKNYQFPSNILMYEILH